MAEGSRSVAAASPYIHAYFPAAPEPPGSEEYIGSLTLTLAHIWGGVEKVGLARCCPSNEVCGMHVELTSPKGTPSPKGSVWCAGGDAMVAAGCTSTSVDRESLELPRSPSARSNLCVRG